MFLSVQRREGYIFVMYVCMSVYTCMYMLKQAKNMCVPITSLFRHWPACSLQRPETHLTLRAISAECYSVGESGGRVDVADAAADGGEGAGVEGGKAV